MRKFFAYVRVSTVRQGEHGVSLQEQRDAISRYAERNAVQVIQWFEERETAAKRGRPVFMRMLKLLRRGKADGVIIHKIDRGARNLKDWAELGELSDQGIEIRFTQDSVDLTSRGGRLSADILAVVAADYVRNLREETRKGFYGRLKQGVYPLPAPLGYLDTGAGKPKEPDPRMAPIVRRAFELYATGNYGLKRLRDELARLGLRNRRGGRVTLNGVSRLLNNPYYIGLIRLERSGETFPGAHKPLVTKALFDRVHSILRGKTAVRTSKHNFVFRRLLTCAGCGYALIGELHKGHVYYRCHVCPQTSVREEDIEAAFERAFLPLQFTGQELEDLRKKAVALASNWTTEREESIRNATLQLDRIAERLARLTDAYLDGVVDKELFEERKTQLLMERRDVEERVAGLRDHGTSPPQRLAEFLELSSTLNYGYKTAIGQEKREMVTIVTSNRTVSGKTLEITLLPPFSHLAQRREDQNGRPYRGAPRTSDTFVQDLTRPCLRPSSVLWADHVKQRSEAGPR